MSTSVGMKAKKKQSLSIRAAETAPAPNQFEIYLLSLENACMRVLEGDYNSDDPETISGQQRLMNIAKPISMALAECGGLQRFHYHYRHREDDESILHPVLENPVDTLAKACEAALRHCRNDMMGVHDAGLLKTSRMLENALQGFLQKYADLRNS